MRPTWHFVTAPDIHWMLELTRSRVQRALTYAYRQFGLDAATRTRARRVFERALGNCQSLTRVELAGHLARAGLFMKGAQLALATIHSELEGVMCSGPRRGKQSTYALLAERAPIVERLSHDEAVAELTKRYFRSHGPATARDFAWWSGLAAADIKRGLEICKARSEVVGGRAYWTTGDPPVGDRMGAGVHLLPSYDEYLVAYRDRVAVPREAGSRGVLQPAIVDAGQIIGTWSVARRTDDVVLKITAESRQIAQRETLIAAATRYGRFLNLAVTLSFSAPSAGPGPTGRDLQKL